VPLDRQTMDGWPEGFTEKDAASLRAFAKNADWVIDHPEEIEPYVGKVIVVIDQKIVAVGTNSLELRRAFVDRQDAYIRFVAPYRRPRMWRLGPASASI